MKELTERERMGWPSDADALFNRTKKVGEDPDVELFGLQWSKEEGFGAVILGGGHNISLLGPRKDWERTLTSVLDLWENIKEGGRHGGTTEDDC